jgi:hypothetical protein
VSISVGSSRGLEFLGELGEGQAELIGAHAFGFLAEEFVTEEVEFLAQGEVFSLGLRQRGFERRNARLSAREIRDRGHARIIDQPRSSYNTRRVPSRDPLVPPPPPRVRQIGAREQQQQIGTAHLDRRPVGLGGPGERALLEPFVEHPEARAVPRENLQPIPAAIAKQEEMPREWLCVATHSRSSVTDHDLWRR